MTAKDPIARVSFLALGVISVGLSGTHRADACTTVLIGKALTADGSVIHAHNEDMGNEAVGRLWSVEAALHPEGERVAVPYLDLPQPRRSLGYWAAGNALGATGLGVSDEVRPYDSVLVGLNEDGVSMSCNWAYSREQNREGIGLRRYAMRQLLLERATSARHGVELLGAWIETHGQADWGGLIYHLADSEEAWVVETTTHNWVARRVRDDEFHVTANRFRIGSNYDLASKTLLTDALKNGWGAPTDGRLDFARVYGQPDKMDQAYDTRREARVEALLGAKIRSITPDDLLAVLRDRYEGSGYYTPPQSKPVWRDDLEADTKLSRTISTNLAQSTFVAHLRPYLPVSIGSVMWFGLGTPGYAGYVPLYAGGGTVPEAYSSLEFEEADTSAWGLFRRLQRTADRQYEVHYPIIREFWNKEHASVVERQGAVEAKALALLDAGKPLVAKGILSTLTQSRADDALSDVRKLLSSVKPMEAITP